MSTVCELCGGKGCEECLNIDCKMLLEFVDNLSKIQRQDIDLYPKWLLSKYVLEAQILLGKTNARPNN